MVHSWRVRMSGYAELAVTTNFSFLRGASHAEELVRREAEVKVDFVELLHVLCCESILVIEPMI